MSTSPKHEASWPSLTRRQSPVWSFTFPWLCESLTVELPPPIFPSPGPNTSISTLYLPG
jgi:hypothetical protein